MRRFGRLAFSGLVENDTPRVAVVLIAGVELDVEIGASDFIQKGDDGVEDDGDVLIGEILVCPCHVDPPSAAVNHGTYNHK